ncbi:BRCA1-A complex subunit RAP80 isoform X2 [Fukomys damarensis]|uniref:BRCA1-A complex subunit RAP80 isoform X2 n=3 Tax=Fukomys damarensis TaxID=885580 RepID=UPI00053F4FFB|nr:BRCA1-A complex subunit RAP80 isoform X2 [Fukomys damarensis]XP_010620385.1 BRCA1-A complex subunit RAP80 isoform X2 [Fukomys damarensis]XP_010620386.1 BRCA1-A complex subunit RAP80 isoform X2 [Fukomys damarensis]XP_010620387.1 BRCA1-A complex subunit RAP80 isoform X2 [Fukomys damarensis]XP_010620388.1 BRCA1-A complex subunit RAP80 isoform X2 [Fukomys damarensis]XP_010620389.1 BRCA1-A complex subunit RAP80 isoform X2 [Fukomys damarensis]XP_019062751.1 BRCA1-A complex subunit RAP80 isoform 
MPRRKKKVKEASESQNLEKKDMETTSSVSVKRKRRVEDTFIVISDSDGEEPKEETELQKMKTKQSNRAKCLAKRKIAQMTEEEQFALALKMSEQEAKDMNTQEEEEEELLRKAIAESLNSCRSSDASATRTRPLAIGPSSHSHQEKTTDSGTTEGIWQLVPPSLFKGSHISQGNEAEEREDPWDHTENTEEEPVSGSSGSWDQSNQPVSENENVKCFGRCTGHLAEHTQCGKPQESTGRGCAVLQAAQGRGDTSRRTLPIPADVKGLQDIGDTVHYFWGIPFCPAGVDPNQYTKVILCQLEVYQKSLKMAQRQLFKKKGFGEPVLPSPPSLIQNECAQGDQASEKNEGISEDMGDEDKEERQESRASVWHSKTKDIQENQIKSLKQKLLLEEEPTTSHGQSSQGLFVEETSEEGSSAPGSQSIATLTSKRRLLLMPESSAEEITVCPVLEAGESKIKASADSVSETQLSSPETFDLEREDSSGSRKTLDEVKIIMRDKEVGNREDGEKETPISTFSSSNQVSCPLCDQGFPATQIERHAMYCNGLMEQDAVLTRRQREAKSKSDRGTAAQTFLDIDKVEKCYLCKSLVPFGEYQCHVDSCLQLARGDQGDGPEGSGKACPVVKRKRLKNSKEKGHNEGRLLNLLEQSEQNTIDAEIKTKSSEIGTFRLPSEEEAGCSRAMQSSLIHLNLNESPIKSFVSISEATDCLIDFKKQLAIHPGSRKRTKASRGRRRKH